MPRLYFKNAVFPLTDKCLCRDTKFENHIFPVFVNSVNQIENPQASQKDRVRGSKHMLTIT